VLYRCYAKINLTLEVLGRRADGFHDLTSLAHTIGLADDLRVEPADELLTRVAGIEAIENNLVTRAAHLLASSTSTRLGAELTLVKRIPSAAGLGGGSTDAAATLVALNSLWGTRLGYSSLSTLAAQLGSDVPFFVRGGAAVMRGRGDVLEPLPPVVGQWLVLAVPGVMLPNKTATLYAALVHGDFSSGEATAAVATHIQQHQPLTAAHLVNAFARAAREVFPGLAELWAELETSCARTFHLSGAGPSLFALASSKGEARALAAQAERLGVPAQAARTVRHARTSIRPPAIRYA
jgi:4-diphosphocytidyl-2-C-methyl-D-erythritol kinase